MIFFLQLLFVPFFLLNLCFAMPQNNCKKRSYREAFKCLRNQDDPEKIIKKQRLDIGYFPVFTDENNDQADEVASLKYDASSSSDDDDNDQSSTTGCCEDTSDESDGEMSVGNHDDLVCCVCNQRIAHNDTVIYEGSTILHESCMNHIGYYQQCYNYGDKKSR